MVPETSQAGTQPSAEIDLDEDLFDFDAVSSGGEEEESLREVLAAFDAEAVAPVARVEALAPSAGASAIRQVRAEGAARPAAAPETAPSAGPTSTPWLSRVSLILLASVTALNALVAVVVMRSTNVVREGLQEVGSSMESTVRRLEDGVREVARSEVSAAQGLPALDAQTHPALERAVEEIASGDFVRARQRIYSLLAVIDRLAPSDRDAVESRASYLLARTYHLEALARAGSSAQDGREEADGATAQDAAAAPQPSAHDAEEHR